MRIVRERGRTLGLRSALLALLLVLSAIAKDWAALVVCVAAPVDELGQWRGLINRNKGTETRRLLFNVGILLFLIPAIVFLVIDAGAFSLALAAALVAASLGLLLLPKQGK